MENITHVSSVEKGAISAGSRVLLGLAALIGTTMTLAGIATPLQFFLLSAVSILFVTAAIVGRDPVYALAFNLRSGMWSGTRSASRDKDQVEA